MIEKEMDQQVKKPASVESRSGQDSSERNYLPME